MSDPVIYRNGSFLKAADARVAPDDAGFERGDGVFETLRVQAGVALEVPEHLRRLRSGLQRIELPIPEDDAELAAAVQGVAAAARGPLSRLRITVSAGTEASGPTRLIRTIPYESLSDSEYEWGVPAVTLPGTRIDTGSPLCGLKSLSYGLFALGARKARAAGAWEGLLGNERGELVEGTRSNVLAVSQGRFLTPVLSSGCLPGIIRGMLLREGLVEEATITMDQLGALEGLGLTNSLVGLLPVARLDGRELLVSPELRRLGRRLEELRTGPGP